MNDKIINQSSKDCPSILNEPPLKAKRKTSSNRQSVVITNDVYIYTYPTESIELTAELEPNPDSSLSAIIRILPIIQIDPHSKEDRVATEQKIDSGKISINNVPDTVSTFCLYIDFNLKKEINDPKRPIKVIIHDDNPEKD